MEKSLVILLVPILILSVLSGCLGESEKVESSSISITKKNQPPEVIINCRGTINDIADYVDTTKIDAIAYSGDEVTFDASDSYDPDGEIVSYEWILDYPDKIAKGKIVTHSYCIDDIFSVEIPYTVQIILTITDNYGSIIPHTYTIGIIPRELVFYFDYKTLKIEKPDLNQENIKPTLGKFRPIEKLEYALDESVSIQKCSWNATIYFKKPFFTFVNRVSLTLFNASGGIIVEQESSPKLFDFSREKTVLFSGKIDNKEDFHSIKISISGFSLMKKINILYGGETASFISFNFIA